jgi:hypothetical protein
MKASCKHDVLVLVPVKSNKLRCTHCHLVITEDELGSSYCPECFEACKKKRRDFEKFTEKSSGSTRYCCERCGMIIEC